MKNIFLFFFTFYFCLCDNENNTHIGTMKITGRETEAMRLFKINAQGLLPQIFQKTYNNSFEINKTNSDQDEIEITVKHKNKIIQLKKGHYQETIIP